MSLFSSPQQDGQGLPLKLLAALMRTAPFQPATNLWRAVELAVLVDKAFPFLTSAQTILDLGCGDGKVMRLLRPHLPQQARITGMDIDAQEVAAAQSDGIYEHVACARADAMPFPDGAFDAVISNSVLEHIDPIGQTLSEASRVLRAGGWFVATVPSDSFHACLKGPWSKTISMQAYYAYIDERLAHRRYWSAQDWQRELQRVGIVVEAAIPYLDQSQTQRWELLSRLTGGLLYRLAGRRQSPIRLQRQLGLRRAGLFLPWFLAKILSRLCTLGLKEDRSLSSCLLIIGQKR